MKEGSVVRPNASYGKVMFVDRGAAGRQYIQVSTKTISASTRSISRLFRKEYISGGDLEISITGKITSKQQNFEVYPEAEVSKFPCLMQFKGVPIGEHMT